MATIQQMNFARTYTLGQLKKLAEADWDEIPAGFHNNVRWNAGHIFVSLEGFTKAIAPDYDVQHPDWTPLFTTGTSPSGWNGNAPSNEELLDALKTQTGRIADTLEGKLDSSIANPLNLGGHELKTGDAVLQFTVWHEGAHAGLLNAFSHILNQ
ncbi:DinB family protein [Bhargavaea ullalensis]|uniref:DinB-like domain-containing protein n=1 Tax=Bhargavaea ullalensis TaxID=1265685 RepID=A0ABV2GB77_9BACL